MSMYCLARYNDCQYEKERYHLARLMLRGRNKVLVTILSVLMMSCPRSAELTSRQVLGSSRQLRQRDPLRTRRESFQYLSREQ
jgi:hypothetical protein